MQRQNPPWRDIAGRFPPEVRAYIESEVDPRRRARLVAVALRAPNIDVDTLSRRVGFPRALPAATPAEKRAARIFAQDAGRLGDGLRVRDLGVAEEWFLREIIRHRVRPDETAVHTNEPWRYADGLGSVWLYPTDSLPHWDFYDWFRDFLEDDGDLATLSLERAYRLNELWHAAQARRGKGKGYETHNVVYEYPDGWQIVQLETLKDYEVEGNLMGHCIASYHGIDSEVFSLRDPQDAPHVTFDTTRSNRVNQIAGKSNDEPIDAYKARLHTYFTERGPFQREPREFYSDSIDDVETWIEQFEASDEYGLTAATAFRIDELISALNRCERGGHRAAWWETKQAYRLAPRVGRMAFEVDQLIFATFTRNLTWASACDDEVSNLHAIYVEMDSISEAGQQNFESGNPYPQRDDFKTDAAFDEAERAFFEEEDEAFNAALLDGPYGFWQRVVDAYAAAACNAGVPDAPGGKR